MELAEKRYAQWLAQQGLEPELRQELDAMYSDAEKVTDAFYRDLEFGTAGLRGVLGAGTNRMNIYVIRRATQAVAQYLNETELPKTVAIGHDSRIKSDVFAREAAAVFAANGITAYLYPRLEPVPALSFAVRHLHCGLGVCVTASHNPAEYNGYKVYGSDGCQMTPEAAKRVVALLEHMDYFTSAKTTDFDAALAAGSIRYIPDEVLDAFVDAVYAQRVGSGEGIENLKLVYTPLNGAGLECVKKLTQKLDIRNMTIVKEQEQPDGHFPTCPYPNPEIRQAMELGLQYCDRVHPDILIGGLICVVGQLILNGYTALELSEQDAAAATSVSLVFLSAVLTALSVYDDLAKIAGAGTLVPITGFANAVVSPAIEFKAEGFVTGMAAKMFIIAGPVIVYGTVASVLYGVILVIFGG